MAHTGGDAEGGSVSGVLGQVTVTGTLVLARACAVGGSVLRCAGADLGTTGIMLD